jgi:hypothetical protein
MLLDRFLRFFGKFLSCISVPVLAIRVGIGIVVGLVIG